MEEEALSARLSTQEKLLISQAVYKLGALDWDKISGLLANHPVIEGRPAEWFDTKSCEAYYVGLMTEVGINVPAQDAARPQAKVHLRLAQNFYLARLQELKSSIAEYEQKFTTLMAEIAAIKSGSMDKSIKDEIRAGLARKFGKKLLDSWVPDEEAIKEAIAAGPPSEEELRSAPAQVEEAPATVTEVPVTSETATVAAPALEEPAPAAVQQEQATEPESKETKAREQPVTEVQEDVVMEESKAPSERRAETDVPIVTEAVEEKSAEVSKPGQPSAPSSPASDLSSAPDDNDKPVTPHKPTAASADVAEEEDDLAAKTSTRASKRKASTQPRGAPPASKRSVRRKTSATPVEPAPAEEENAEKKKEDNRPKNDANSQVQEQEQEDMVMEDAEAPAENEATPATVEEEAEAAPALEPEPVAEREGEGEGETAAEAEAETAAEVQQEEVPVTRGRRSTRRESVAATATATGSRTKRGTSPASSPSKHMSPPPSGKRAPSASSAMSATSTPAPAPAEERRSARRHVPKGRGMRDEVVSKLVRDRSEAVESVKEEDDEAEDGAEQAQEDEQAQAQEHDEEQEEEQEKEQEPERPPTRSSRRGVKEDSTPNNPDLSAPLPDQRKGTRRISTRGGAQPAETPDDDKPPVVEEPAEEKEKEKDKKPAQAKRPRHSSPRETKAAQRMLNGLLDQIAGHRNGNVFAQPVKKSEAPDYYEVIKRPMDLKTIRSKIRDGHITTIEEFERDAMLIFANATMYNPKGSAVYDMAVEMMKDAEQHIQHLKDVQRRIGR